MAFSLVKDDIRSGDGQDSSGKQTFTRSMGFTFDPARDTVVDLMQSNFYPQAGSVHPIYTQWTLDNVSAIDVVRSPEGRDEMWLTGKYVRGGRSGGASQQKDVPPWKLGAQNFQSAVEQQQTKQVLQLFSKDQNKWIPYVNTAGCRLIRMRNETIRVISFDMNYEYKGKLRVKNAWERLNGDSVKVCSVSIPAYCGKLMPMSSSLHTVYENDGKTVKWKYETVHVTIKINQHTWIIEDLNVGRLAKFPVEEGGDQTMLAPIFQYTPWLSKDPAANAKIKPRFGSIDNVVAAQKAYETATGDKSTKIPFSQVDEDLPLNKNGGIYQEAINDPENNPYLTISGYETEGESWNKYDLPKEY